MAKQKPFAIRLLIFLLFFGGLALNLLVVADVAWLHWWLGPPAPAVTPPSSKPAAKTPAPVKDGQESSHESLPQSVVFIRVSGCGAGGGTGTGFVVASGYVVTAEHVVESNLRCGAKLEVVDMNQRVLPATVAGHSGPYDIALLEIADRSLPPLRLADSEKYLRKDDLIQVFTLGYPLPGLASTPGKASFSGTGSVSKYEESIHRFVTSNLNLNPGNSGGPIILTENYQVLGVASAVLVKSGGPVPPAGIGYAAPASAIEALYRDRTGKSLP